MGLCGIAPANGEGVLPLLVGFLKPTQAHPTHYEASGPSLFGLLSVGGLVAFVATASSVLAQQPAAEAAAAAAAAAVVPAIDPAALSSLRVGVDTVWVLVAGTRSLMNAGFALVESGLSRAKRNRVNILAKNFIVFAIASISFYVVGWG